MIRPALFLTAAEYGVLLLELCGSDHGDYEPTARELGLVEPLRLKIQTAIQNGERVIICPDRVGTSAPIIPPAAAPKAKGRRPKTSAKKQFCAGLAGE